MSKLRKQLQDARRDYDAQRYPGDLAADVLGQVAPARSRATVSRSHATTFRSHWVRNLALAAGLAVAATVAIVVVNRDTRTSEVAKHDPVVEAVDPIETTDGSNQTAAGDDEDFEETWSLVPGQPTQTQDSAVSFVPSFQSMSFSLPSVSLGGIDSYTEEETLETPSVQ